MKSLLSLAFIAMISFNSFAQSDDIPVDESLIVRISDVANGGYLSKTALAKATSLNVTEKGSTITSFDYVCTKAGMEANIHNEGAELNQEIINHMKNLKIGSKISFENIHIENASGEVLSRPVMVTIKS